jgi:hypothetical protein
VTHAYPPEKKKELTNSAMPVLRVANPGSGIRRVKVASHLKNYEQITLNAF